MALYESAHRRQAFVDDAKAGRQPDISDMDASESYETLSLVLGAAGVVAAGTGVTLLLLSSSQDDDHVALELVGKRVSLRGRF